MMPYFFFADANKTVTKTVNRMKQGVAHTQSKYLILKTIHKKVNYMYIKIHMLGTEYVLNWYHVIWAINLTTTLKPNFGQNETRNVNLTKFFVFLHGGPHPNPVPQKQLPAMDLNILRKKPSP